MKVRQYVSRMEVKEGLRQQLVACWAAVTNSGGAVGVPFPPVSEDDVAPVLDELVRGLRLDRCRLFVAEEAGALLGWAVLSRGVDPLTAHWGSLHHVQSRPDCRRKGVGSSLVNEVRRVARDEMSLEQLRASVRGGMGLESFYERLGWRVIGTWPAALRFGPDDDRDEILLHLGPL